MQALLLRTLLPLRKRRLRKLLPLRAQASKFFACNARQQKTGLEPVFCCLRELASYFFAVAISLRRIAAFHSWRLFRAAAPLA
jgi:hypothetical protein